MNIYLLPWSKNKTRMDIVRKDLHTVWKEGEGNRFPELNPLRESVIKELKVSTQPLAPAYRRYKGRFWEELSFWALPSRVKEEIDKNSLVLSPLMGVMAVSDLVPYYEVGWKTECCERNLNEFWREHLRGLLDKLLSGKVVWDFLSSEDRGLVQFPEGTRRVVFEYYRKGKRVINTLPHRAYTLRYIVEMGVDIGSLERINFLDYKVKKIEEEEWGLKVLLQSEGRYI